MGTAKDKKRRFIIQLIILYKLKTKGVIHEKH